MMQRISPVGRATEEHVARVRATLQVGGSSSSAAPGGTELAEEQSDAQASWNDNRLPGAGWWEALSWQTALENTQNTFVQIPDRLRGAVSAARGKTLEVLSEARARGHAEPEWKALLFFDCFLLGHSRSATTCAESLEERLALWWGGQWDALWAMVAAQSAPPLAPRGEQADRQRAKRVHTLAAAGEEGRALRAVTSERPAARTPETYSKLRALFPESGQDTSRAQALSPAPSPTPELREQVEEEVLRLLLRPPRLSAPGLLGTRHEHLAGCADDPETLKLLCEAVTCLAFGEAPDPVLSALRTGELVALCKDSSPDPEVRPLLVGSTLRRLGLRALVRVKKEQLREAAGDHQYGVGRKAGAQLLYKRLEVQAELRPDAVFLKVDLRAAFQTLERGPALQALSAKVPELSASLQAFYGQSSTHLWRTTTGSFEQVSSHRGFDQGCPLAAAAFSVGQEAALGPFLEDLCRLDPEAKIYSFLDDTYLVTTKGLLALALQGLREALSPLGLALNPTKTNVWSPSGPGGLPAEFLPHYTQTLGVLGAKLRSAGDRDEAPLLLGVGFAGLPTATGRLDKLWQQLWKLHKAGLPKQALAALLKTYAGGASQYPLQLQHATETEVKDYDDALLNSWESLAGRSLTPEAKTRLSLPTKSGGCGVQLAATRQHAAYWASWTKCLEEVLADTSHTTAADLRRHATARSEAHSSQRRTRQTGPTTLRRLPSC